jgi:hypothetical protein
MVVGRRGERIHAVIKPKNKTLLIQFLVNLFSAFEEKGFM